MAKTKLERTRLVMPESDLDCELLRQFGDVKTFVIGQFSVADTARAISCRDSLIRRAGFAADDYNQ